MALSLCARAAAAVLALCSNQSAGAVCIADQDRHRHCRRRIGLGGRDNDGAWRWSVRRFRTGAGWKAGSASRLNSPSARPALRALRIRADQRLGRAFRGRTDLAAHACRGPRSALFSFLLVLSPFCLSVCGAHVCAADRPSEAALARAAWSARKQLTLFKASARFLRCWSGCRCWNRHDGVKRSRRAPWPSIFGLYGAVMSVRWFARCWTYGWRKSRAYFALIWRIARLLCDGDCWRCWPPSTSPSGQRRYSAY